MQKLRWGIIGAGRIARVFAQDLNGCVTGILHAVGSRDAEKAAEFAAEFNAPKHYGSYADLLTDTEINAVYIATPHPQHLEWTVRAAQARKHILCEKPLGVSTAEARSMIAAARKHNVFLMEAFMYRCHPQTAKLIELLRAKAIGAVRLIHASFGFKTADNFRDRKLRNELAGGGIMDVGCYPVSMARLVAGVALGNYYAEPLDVSGAAYLGETGVDEWAVANLKFKRGILAELRCAVQLQLENELVIYGSDGVLRVPTPWKPLQGLIKLEKYGEAAQEFRIEDPRPIYAIEADVVAENISRREAPNMTLEDTLGNMQTLDRWRAAAGLVFDFEK